MSILNAFRETRSTIDARLDTPALEGKRNHETLYGSYARSAWHWRVAFFGVLLLLIWEHIHLSLVLHEKQYVPVVIAEHEDGSTRFVGTPDPTWKPMDRTIIAELKWLVQTMRGRTTDAQYDRSMWQRAIDRSTAKGQTALGLAYQELSAVPEKGRIQVEILSVNKASEHTFDLRWQERRHDISNALVSTKRFRGLFTVVLDVPGTLTVLAKNENGVWYDGWNIDEEKGP